MLKDILVAPDFYQKQRLARSIQQGDRVPERIFDNKGDYGQKARRKHIELNSAVGAVLGAAYGDALGWPNERISRSNMGNSKSKGPLSEFQKWTRQSGGRYYPHEEINDSGTYSDDTQLIL